MQNDDSKQLLSLTKRIEYLEKTVEILIKKKIHHILQRE